MNFPPNTFDQIRFHKKAERDLQVGRAKTQAFENLNSTDNNFELQKNSRRASEKQDNFKMKQYFRDEMQKSLEQRQISKIKQKQEQIENRRAMAEFNGPLDYMERQISKRDEFIKGCWDKQQKMRKYYIDQDQLKHRRALKLINSNWQTYGMQFQNDRYQISQKVNLKNVSQTNSQLRVNQQSGKHKLSKYDRQYLDGNSQTTRHNPITNPISYHIQNPYLRIYLSKY